jgi:hypothetical protein
MTTHEILIRDYRIIEREKVRMAEALEAIANHGLDARQCMELAKRTLSAETQQLHLSTNADRP